MATLKEIRNKFGLTQNEIAEKIKTNAPTISNYENGVSLPELEDAIILERNFDSKIDWNEKVTPQRKHEIVQSIIELYEKYPLEMVSEFVARTYRRNTTPENLITHYGNIASGSGGILLPPQFQTD